jgi:oligogalacturonide lyase
MAVNEKSGVMIQVTEGGYMGMLNVARKSMKLYWVIAFFFSGRRSRITRIECSSVTIKCSVMLWSLDRAARGWRVCL